MDGQVLIFPRGNDVVVTARFPDIPSGTAGATAKLYYKDNRYTADNDPTSKVYTAAIVDDPVFTGATMATFPVPKADNQVTGAFWWRVDATDAASNTRTAAAGTLLVEAV